MPDEDPSGESVVLGFYEFMQLQDRARVMTAAEKAAREEQMKLDKEEKMVRCLQESVQTFCVSQRITELLALRVMWLMLIGGITRAKELHSDYGATETA